MADREPGAGPQALLILALVALALPFVLTAEAHPDELTALSHGLRLAHGEVIYRDFFEFASPLSRWVSGVVAWLAGGPSLVGLRLVQAAANTLAGVQLYRLARALGLGPWESTAPPLALVAGLYWLLPGFSHHWLALPLLLAAVQTAFRARGSRCPRGWALAGLFVGLTTLTLQSDGIVIGAVLVAWIVLDAWLSRETDALAVRLGGLAFGLAAPLAAAAAYFAWHGALGTALYDVWTWTLTHYRTRGGINDITYATDLQVVTSTNFDWVNLPYFYGRVSYFVMLLAGLPALALAALAWLGGVVAQRLKGDVAWGPERARLALVALATAGLVALATRGRADAIHVGVYAPVPVLFYCALWPRWRARLAGPGLGALRALPALALALFVAAGAMQQAHFMRERPAAWCRLAPPDRDLVANPAIRYVREHAAPGDSMVAYPMGGAFYAYALPPASRYTIMVTPGEGYHSADEYADFWREALAGRPRFIVYSPFNGDTTGFTGAPNLPPPGYHLVASPEAPVYRPARPAFVFEREAR